MSHIVALRITNAFFALLALGVGGASFHFLAYPAIAGSGEGFLGTMGGLIALVMASLGVAHLFLAATLGRTGRRTGRGLQTILALALIMTFPLGTFYALYALWVCWANPETRNFFSREEGVLPFPRAATA
ncbi:MAG: hypothetical protein AAGE52_26470 [Myxococcota bacterium]